MKVLEKKKEQGGTHDLSNKKQLRKPQTPLYGSSADSKTNSSSSFNIWTQDNWTTHLGQHIETFSGLEPETQIWLNDLSANLAWVMLAI